MGHMEEVGGRTRCKDPAEVGRGPVEKLTGGETAP